MALAKTKGAARGYAPSIAFGLVCHTPDYYTSSNPYINLIHGTWASWSGTGAGSVNALGWITDMPDGQSVTKYVLIHTPYIHGKVRAGRYAMTWTGPLTVDLTTDAKTIATGETYTDHRVEFTLPELDASNSYGQFITVQVSNSSGTVGSLNDLKIFHTNDEPALDSGEIFTTQFLRSLDGVSVVRTVLLQNTMDAFTPKENYEDYPTEADCSWTEAAPISVLCKLAIKLNKSLWIHVPHKFTQVAMNSMFQEAYSYLSAYPRIKLYVEYSNEVWNTIYPGYVYCRDVKSVGLSVVDTAGNPSSAANDKVACASAHGAMQGWTAAETYFPRERIVRVYCGQCANFANLAGGFEYSDASLYSGADMKTLVDGYGIAPYFNNSQTGYFSVPADMSQKAQVTRKDYLNTDEYWRRVFRCSLVVIEGQVSTTKTQLAAKSASIKLFTYESGQHNVVSLTQTNCWSATVVANELDFGVDITSIFENAEQLAYVYNAGLALFSGAAPLTGYLVRIGTTNNKLKVYANQAAYDADTPATLEIGGGTWYLGNYTRFRALGQKYKDLMDSQLGVALYASQFKMCKKYGVTLYHIYASSGGYTEISAGRSIEQSWGLKRSHWDADANYPRAAWFRQFAKG